MTVLAMVDGRLTSRWTLMGVWFCVFVSVFVMASQLPTGVDARTYRDAIREVRAGISPYTSGLQRIQRNHANGQKARTMNYIYPPATLPAIQALGNVPPRLLAMVFWAIYSVSLWVVLRLELSIMPPGRERAVFALLAPFTLFFPGLLFDDSILSGNIAPSLYGVIGLGMWRGLRAGHWDCFYAAVLLASIVKPTMLTFLIIAPLVSYGQWLWTALVAFTGCSVFLVSPKLWPKLAGQYSLLLHRELLWNDEFGGSLPG